MRLIDADDALEQIQRREKMMVGDNRVSTESFKHFINNRPTIDAVPVVRCRECIHREIFFNDPMQMFCHKWLRTMPTNLDFFCAYGENMDAEVEG